jgi:DNA recombination protein RmuC
MDGIAIITLLIGAALGAAASWFASAARARATLAEERQRATADAQSTATELATARQRLAALPDLERRADRAAEDAATRLDERDIARAEVATLQARLAALEATHAARERADEARATALMALQADATGAIQKLAQDLLEAKTKSLAETNARDLGALIDPLKERIAEFKAKVEEVYVVEGKERATLGEQVRTLTELNQTVRRETQGLTEALRGSNKVQGDWGELVLTRVLEASGLREGQEFVTQESVRDADGNLLRPDVVLTLPNGRKVVIDSKVSLVSWVQYVEATDDDARTAAARALVASVRNHLKGLSPKGYESLYGAGALDFVVLFVPLEGAFAQALAADPALQDDAWKQQILFAGPTTILFALRTIGHLWRQERQTRNALEIAEQAGGLYDKFVGFLADMDNVERSLTRAVEAHAGARRALGVENGNIVRRVERLRDLGVRTKKEIGQAWLDADESPTVGRLPTPADSPEGRILPPPEGTARYL